MLQPRKRKNSQNKWAIIIPLVLVLISSVLVFNERVLSTLGGVNRNIEFNGQTWDVLSGPFAQQWKTSSENVTFTVDLTDEFKHAGLTAPVAEPFTVTAAHEGKAISPKVSGTEGRYDVSIPFSGEGRLDIRVEMQKDEKWKTEIDTHIFHVTKDSVAPVIKLSGMEDGALSTMAGTIDVEVLEKHFASNSVQISATRNGKAATGLPEWKNTAETTKHSYSFTEEGDYTFTAKAVDEFGNASGESKLSFAIRSKGPVLHVTADGQELQNNMLMNKKELKLAITSKIKIGAAAVTIFKDSKKVETVNFPDGNWETALHYPIAEEGVYEFHVWVKESHARGDEYSLNPFMATADHTAPELTIEGAANGEVYGGDTKITGIVAEQHPGTVDFHVTKKAINGEETTVPISLANGFTASEEGEYTVKLASADAAGNQAAPKTLTFKVDKEKPALSISEDVNGKYFNSNKELTISVNDMTLDLNHTILTVKKETKPYDIGNWIQNLFRAEVKHRFTDEGAYEINLSSTDGQGKSHAIQPVTFTIDKTDPELKIENITNGEQLKQARDVTISVSDANIDWEQTSLTIARNGQSFAAIKGEEVVNTHNFTADGNYTINLEAADKAGNRKAHDSISFTIDASEPDLGISGVKNGEHYQKVEDLELSIEDLTFLLKETKLNITKDGEPYKLESGGWDESFTKGGLKRAIRKLSFDQDGDYEFSLETTDLLGNYKKLGPIAFTIDGTAPMVELAGIADGAFVQKGKEVKVKVNEHNYENNNVSILVKKDQETYEFGKWKNVSEASEISHTFTEDGDYEVTVEAEDKAGNKTEPKKLHFTVDNAKPVLKIAGVTDGKFYSKGQSVNISVDERNFKNNSVQLSVTRRVEVDGVKANFPIGEWKNVAALSDLAYEFDRDGDYEISVSATDAAGNEGVAQKVLFTIDQVQPELSISGVENDHHYRSDQPVSFRISDRNIDLSQTHLKVERNGKAYGIGSPALTSKIGAAKNFTFSEEGSYVLSLDTADKAGNKKVHEQIAFIIDKTNPAVTIDGAENNSFNPTGKNVTISVDELNFATNNVDISATKDGANFPIGIWRNSGKLSKLGYNFTQDGLYTVLATATDKAGNGPISQKLTFTVDKVKPAIEITGVKNNAYYNVDKPVNVKIRDTNLDVNRISVTRSGAGYGVGGFTVNGDAASLSHTFSKEGDYSMVVEATDKAGNSYSETMKFTIDKTKPVITPKFKGENRVIKNGEYINKVFTPEFALDEAEDMIITATLNNGANMGKNIPVAAKEMAYTYKILARDKAGNESTLEISFTLDTTKPKLDVSGVLDGFFNKDIAPKVVYSDIHLDQSKTSVTLNGKPFTNGTKLEYEQDYILKAVVTDLASNVTTRTIVFTIDKTSPVIKFKEPISNKYFNSDLLPQLLIEDMSAYDIIAMLLDGKPYEIGDPIKEEGKHVMFFEVKDKAGNIQQLSVEFIIDKTAPKVVFEGVKKSGKYYDPIDISISLDNPNDTLKSVLINGELFEGEVIEENGKKVIKTTLSDIQSYEIKVIAYDEAGNETNKVLPFEIVQKGALMKLYESKQMLGGTLTGIAALVGAAVTVLIRRRKVKAVEEE